MVGRTRYELPLAPWLARKFDALERELELRVLASPAGSVVPDADPRFRLLPPWRPSLLDGLAFYLRLPGAVRAEIRAFHPDAVLAESPFVGACALLGRRLAGSRAPVIVEVHGDWRISTRLYGSPLRRLLAPVADGAARVALRRADAVRALSTFTGSLVERARGRPADAVFPTYSDLGAFAGSAPLPLPSTPTALFVGALELYKNVDGIAHAWRKVAREVPQARLVMIGSGSRRALVDALVRELPESVEHTAVLAPDAVARAMDASTVLLLPSRFEGLGRVVLESFARGRGLVGGACGGILDLADDGVEGLLVAPEDADAIAEALVRVLTEPGLAERLGAAARARFESWQQTPEQFALRMRELVDRAIARPARRLPA
jgi:glycosyltransferase involved in cell wall biosynthesis